MKNWKEKSIIKGILQTFVKNCFSGRFTKYGGPEEYGGHMIKYEELWRLTHQDRIDKKLKKIKWRWIVHTPRKIYWGLSIKALDWSTQGQRRRGRTKEDLLRAYAGPRGEANGKDLGEVKNMARNY